MKQLIIILVLLLSGCATTKNSNEQAAVRQGDLIQQYMEQGLEDLSYGHPEKALGEFDQAIALCKKQFAGSEERVYVARGMTDSIYYMLKARVDNESAVAVATDCADAFYLRGYASIELGQIDAGEQHLNKALEFSPVNSMYLSEMGHIYHIKEDWQKALDTFAQAEEFSAFSPEELKASELARAKRGVGFSLIELGRLDEAEAKFRECLELDPNDEVALHELKYIEEQRNSG
ncbi:tetratricopeptide repeat protein [Pseudidiomarina sp.]|uniref:tetratricopeptide repeat protein n=1 Tax=Pseudidiomarina sp. TaxID=2081707 RepID=UPI00299E3356|nr:tetratricopeptide repeat protein [Pseudidiomarina sp.]MDX1705563.1 tetratricopeptide repeat protein [Pseudidiomarina sp.]